MKLQKLAKDVPMMLIQMDIAVHIVIEHEILRARCQIRRDNRDNQDKQVSDHVVEIINANLSTLIVQYTMTMKLQKLAKDVPMMLIQMDIAVHIVIEHEILRARCQIRRDNRDNHNKQVSDDVVEIISKP
ncbi:hypothetical protein MIR68_005830 [Amoeboaphelidium protococcarum]|nr:hypothetical protein MIR68_005830 [Amoeboaphelidium protococcarum]